MPYVNMVKGKKGDRMVFRSAPKTPISKPGWKGWSKGSALWQLLRRLNKSTKKALAKK
jgi:hypothetical protein